MLSDEIIKQVNKALMIASDALVRATQSLTSLGPPGGTATVTAKEVDWAYDASGGGRSVESTFTSPDGSAHVAQTVSLRNNATSYVNMIVAATSANHADAAGFSLRPWEFFTHSPLRHGHGDRRLQRCGLYSAL